jgi:hypothetical protein
MHLKIEHKYEDGLNKYSHRMKPDGDWQPEEE